MTKQQLARAIGNGKQFVTRKECAENLGYKDARSIDKYLLGLPKINKTKYFALDIAERIIEEGLYT